MDEKSKIEKLRKAGEGPGTPNQHADLTHVNAWYPLLKRRAGLGDHRGRVRMGPGNVSRDGDQLHNMFKVSALTRNAHESGSKTN